MNNERCVHRASDTVGDPMCFENCRSVRKTRVDVVVVHVLPLAQRVRSFVRSVSRFSVGLVNRDDGMPWLRPERRPPAVLSTYLGEQTIRS